MTIQETFELVSQGHDWGFNNADYDLTNSFAIELASQGFSQVSIVSFIIDRNLVNDDEAIEIARRVAP